MSGPDARDPLSLAEDGAHCRAPLERSLKGVRIAFSPNMGGLPIDKQVSAGIEAQRHGLQDMGCIRSEEHTSEGP